MIAGEASGDRLGAALMAGIRTLQPDCRFEGIGGPEMSAQGLESRFPMHELSLMGLVEVLPHIRALLRRISQTADAIIAERPDLVITIDSPDFTLRVLARVRAARPDMPVVHYVAPTVWAWRPGRAAKMAPRVDHVLALLPFEPPYMQAAGMSCDFVGHPVVAEPQATVTEALDFRDRHGIGAAPLVLVLPGSRQSEIGSLAARFGETLRLVLAKRPEARLVVPAVAAQAGRLRAAIDGWPGAPLVLEEGALPASEKRAAFAAADVALAASGTVSLELAANAVPMVIAYDGNFISRLLMKRLLLIETVSLPNIVTGTRAIPEFLGERCKPAPMAQALLTLLEDNAARAAQLEVMAQALDLLGRGGEDPGLRAARSVLTFLANREQAGHSGSN